MSSLSSEETVTAILSYLGILVLIPVFAYKQKSEFMSFHIKQGVVLAVAEIAWTLLTWILVGMFGSTFLWMVVGGVSQLVSLAVFILSVVAIVFALQGKKWEIPVVSGFTQMVKL